jgi:hypothetical protein
VRALLIVTSAILLAACAGRDPVVTQSDVVPAGNWRIERQVDRVTGAPLASALLTAPSSHSSQPFPKRVTLQLTCFNQKPLVRLSFEVKVGTSTTNELGYRFDERPGHEIKARFLDGDRVAVIENGPEVSQFIGELAEAKQLYLRIRSLGHGRTSAEFNVDGAQAAIAATTAHCPPPPEPPRPGGKRR